VAADQDDRARRIEELKSRMKGLGVSALIFIKSLPRNRSADVIARQLSRCSTSVGANYRAACLARSQADFVAKLKIVEEELDETLYWIEVLKESGLAAPGEAHALHREAKELLAITIASIKTARSR
jgi:four helix bundle protein